MADPAVEILESPTTVAAAESFTVEVAETVQAVTVAGGTEVVVQETTQTVAVVQAEVVVQVGSEAVAVVEVGVQGPPGPPGESGPQGPPGTGTGRTEVRFDWGDATPRPLLTVPAGHLVERVALYLVEAFDGTGAALAVGDAGDAGRLLAAAAVDPAAVGVYEVRPNLEYGSDTPVALTIVAGAGATAGRGLAVVEYEN